MKFQDGCQNVETCLWFYFASSIFSHLQLVILHLMYDYVFTTFTFVESQLFGI